MRAAHTWPEANRELAKELFRASPHTYTHARPFAGI